MKKKNKTTKKEELIEDQIKLIYFVSIRREDLSEKIKS
jgi:hypothetical protein